MEMLSESTQVSLGLEQDLRHHSEMVNPGSKGNYTCIIYVYRKVYRHIANRAGFYIIFSIMRAQLEYHLYVYANGIEFINLYYVV